MESQIHVPSFGQAIQLTANGALQVPNCPIIPFIEGDGIGVDITPSLHAVLDAAVAKAYGQERRLAWMEIYCGDKADKTYGEQQYLPAETIQAIKDYHVAIKGPLATPIGGGIRSLNVALRQALDLYICQRPIRYFEGVPSPLKHPEKTNMVIFRENSEDIYAGIEWPANSPEANRLIEVLQRDFNVNKIRFPKNCGIGIKPVSQEGSERLIRAAIDYAILHQRRSVTLVHKGNIMKYTEGAFKEWGYQLAAREFGAILQDNGYYAFAHPQTGAKIVIKDIIADNFLQQILLRPEAYDVIATLNLNGDYISDALAAQVGGIGIAPGANIGTESAIFEATHGTAPKYVGQNNVNPGSLLLSGEMLLRHIGWDEAADLVVKGIEKTILSQHVTRDFSQFMPEATECSTRDFTQHIIRNM